MQSVRRSVIVGTGSHVPTRCVANAEFTGREFYGPGGARMDRAAPEVVERFEAITGIRERRWVPDNLVASDIAALAATEALQSSGVDPESLDHIIVAHNFGDVRADHRSSDLVPSLASRVKALLDIESPQSVCYDLPFGCPGWLQGLIQADCFLSAGHGTRALVIGTETLSRVSDPHDRDSLIYADGAGAVVLEARSTDEPVGVLSHTARSDTREHAHLLRMGGSYNPQCNEEGLFLKMQGHKLYEYALRTVPGVILTALEKAQVTLRDVHKMLLHQANAKMDDAIVRRLCKLCGVDGVDEEVVPMTVSWLGNSSVATVPTLLDLLQRGRLTNKPLVSGELAVFASVGAGMNANALVYRLP